MRTNTGRTTLHLALVAVLALGCAGALAQDEKTPAQPVSIVLSPSPATVSVGEKQKFGIEVRGGFLELGTPAWTLTGEIGTVDATGVLTAGPKRARGTVTVSVGTLTATAEVEVVPKAYGACHHDGRILYSVEDGGDSEYDLRLMDADGSDLGLLTPNLADAPEEYDRTLDSGAHACWSPDATRITYEAYGLYGQASILTMEADGSAKRIVAGAEGRSFYRPSFSTDGKQILCDSGTFVDGVRGPGDLYLLNADGTGLTQLTHDPAPEEDACWSPDGERIAFVRERESENGTTCEIWLMDKEGQGATRLTPEGEFDFRQPTWSPDGLWIACTITDAQGPDIGRIEAASGRVEKLTTATDLSNYGPAWTWDGLKILYSTTDAPDLNREIWSIDLAHGNAITNVTNRPDAGNYLRNLTYSY